MKQLKNIIYLVHYIVIVVGITAGIYFFIRQNFIPYFCFSLSGFSALASRFLLLPAIFKDKEQNMTHKDIKSFEYSPYEVKEIHFYESADYIYDVDFYMCWNGTRKACESNEIIIHTTQMGFLSTWLFELGYRIFIHDGIDSYYEIKLGTDNERTEREIKQGHNLFRMWSNGEFDK